MEIGNRNAWVHRDDRVNCAYLKVWNGQAKLNLNRNADIANPDYGALRLRRMFLVLFQQPAFMLAVVSLERFFPSPKHTPRFVDHFLKSEVFPLREFLEVMCQT